MIEACQVLGCVLGLAFCFWLHRLEATAWPVWWMFGNLVENSGIWVDASADCQLLLHCYLILLLLLFDPQGDPFQRGTEVLHCIAVCFYTRQVEVQADLYCKAPLCKVPCGTSQSE